MSNDNTIQVEFGASTQGVETGSTVAAEAIEKSMARMRESFASVSSSVAALKEQVSGAFEGMGAALMKFNNVMFAVQNAIQGGEMFKEFVKDAISTTKESLSLGKAMGITATEASYLKSALTAVGVSQETMVSAATKITRTLLQNEQAFTDLGVATRDSNGHFLSTNDILNATNARLRDFKEGTDRNVEGLKIYGRQWAEVAPLVNKFSGDIEEGKKRAEDLNLVIGVEAVAAMAKYNASQREWKEVTEGIKNTIGQALLPQLTNLANWFASVGPQAVEATRIAMAGYLAIQNEVKASVLTLWGAVSDRFKAVARIINEAIGAGSEGLTAMELFQNVLKVVHVEFIALRIGVEVACSSIKGSLEQIANVARLAGGVIGAALALDWNGVKAAWSEFKSATAKTITDTMDAAVKIAVKGREDIDKAIMGDLGAKSKVTPLKHKEDGEFSDGATGKDAKDKKGPKGGGSQMSDFKDQLRQKLEDEGEYFKDSTEAELDFWNGKRALMYLSVKDHEAIDHEIFQLTKKSLNDQHAIQEAQIDAERNLGREKLAVKEAELDAMKQAGVISDVEALTRAKAIHAQMYALDVEASEQKLNLYGTEAKEREKLLGEIAVAEQKMNATSVKESAAIGVAIRKTWADAFAPVTSAFDTAVKGVISGTTTINKAVQNMAKSILSEYVNLGVKTLASWAAGEAAKTGATATGTAARVALEAGAAVQSVAISAGAAIKNILNYAWEAFAGAYKAIASIPYVGPFLAPVAAGVAFAGVAGAVSSIASASGGYDIPAGVNPLTQLHEKEMVLPAKQADAVRQMAEGGGNGGGDIHVSIKGQKMPGGFFMAHQSELVSALKKARRNGADFS